MPHVDDGTLHAYLDGAVDALADAGALPPGVTRESIAAHLAACADCRSRLEAEREIRERAGIVLQDAAPAYAEPPAFHTIDGPPRRRTWVPLSWAATVVLAAGAGWWGSEIARQTGAPAPVAETSTRTGAAPREPEAAAGPAAEPRAPATITAAPPVAASQSAPDPQAERVESREARDEVASAGVTDAAQNAVRPPSITSAADAQRLEQARRQQLAASPTSAPPAAPMPGSLAAASMVVVPQALHDVLVSTRDDSVRWHPSAGAELPPMLHVDGAAEIEAGVAVRPGFLVTRVRQRLDSGEVVDVVTAAPSVEQIVVTGAAAQRTAGAGAEAAEVQRIAAAEAGAAQLPGGVNELRLVVNGGRVVALRGAVPLERLRGLAGRLAQRR